MAKIALVRVDDRLIHGQVVVKWLHHLGSKDILIVDDELWGDDFMQSVLRLAAPPGVRVHVAPTQGAREQLDRIASQGVLVLVKSPPTALALHRSGVEFSAVNVGGMAAGPNTTRLFKSVSATQEQIAALLDLQARGVRVYFQIIPEEHAVDIQGLLHVRGSVPPAVLPERLART
jgi:mannose/fructose/N-acetylgalactosamine-specific phosphotransferase system component IIB